MAYTSDKKPGGLTQVTSVSGTDNVVVDQSGDVKRATVNQVIDEVFAAKTSAGTPASGDVVVVRRGSDIRQLETQNLIPDGAITKEKIAAAAGIEDSKLATINTAGKVTNNAVQATSANTANRIVTRDGSGNFSAGTVTATLSGNASTATTLQTGRTIAISGDVTGTPTSFNGSANITIPTAITAGSIVNADINNSAAIALSKLATGALPTGITVASANIVNGTIATADIADSAITSAKIADGTIATGDIANSAVTEAKIANSAVTSAKIADGTIATGDIANSAVTSAKIASGAVGASELATGAVTGAAGGGKLAASAITGQTQKTSIADADELLVHSDSDSALRRVAWSVMQPSGTVLQTVYAEDATYRTATGLMPATATTAPSVTEGAEILTATIAPSSTSNKVLVRCCVPVATISTAGGAAFAIFRGSTCIQFTSKTVYVGDTSNEGPVYLEVLDAPASTSNQTYSLRVGCTISATRTVRLNGDTALSFGGTCKITLTLQEIKA